MKFKNFSYLADFSTDWLTCLLARSLTHSLMPLDKHNSRTARARYLIFSLINIVSSRNVPFHQLQELQCLHQGVTFVPLWSPNLSSQPCKVTICGRHEIASVRDIKIDEALLVLCLALATMLWNEFGIAEIEVLWLSCIEIWGVHFTSVFFVFSVMAGWIAEMLFVLFFVYITV